MIKVYRPGLRVPTFNNHPAMVELSISLSKQKSGDMHFVSVCEHPEHCSDLFNSSEPHTVELHVDGLLYASKNTRLHHLWLFVCRHRIIYSVSNRLYKRIQREKQKMSSRHLAACVWKEKLL